MSEDQYGITRQAEAGGQVARQGEWLPIESAPRDGTGVLLFERGRDDVMETGRWNAEAERWVINNNRFWVVYPSHWMPLPKPPARVIPDTGLVCTACRCRAGHAPDCPRADEPWPTISV